MKTVWVPLVAVLALVGCTPDRTADGFIPRNALAVVLSDQPGLAAAALGSGAADLPVASLDGGKPWVAAVLPATPPGFLVALALADKPTAWNAVADWARSRGGMVPYHWGSYAVLTSPGLPAPVPLDAKAQFDLSRVRAGGDFVAVYIDVKNVMEGADFPVSMAPALAALPWAVQNLAGLRLGFGAKAGGLEVRLATDTKPGSPLATELAAIRPSADPSPWTGQLPASGLGAAFSLPNGTLARAAGLLPDAALARRLSALASLVGPRFAVSAVPAGAGWSWALSVEASDPQAVRQALKTLVAGGDLQRLFPAWALDADTPLVYQDKPDGTGVRADLTVGPAKVVIGYGSDRVVAAGGAGALELMHAWQRAAPNAAPWVRDAPAGSSLVATGLLDGLGAHAAVRALPQGNAELRVWVDAAGVKAWEERLPQALMGWLAGAGGWTRAEP